MNNARTEQQPQDVDLEYSLYPDFLLSIEKPVRVTLAQEAPPPPREGPNRVDLLSDAQCEV
jgi:hypothetical protein